MKTREEQVEEIAKAIYATGVALEGTDYAFGVYDDDDHFHRMANSLYAAGIGDVTEWKERAERMHKEALKQKQLVSDSKHSEDALRNQLNCALDMASGMEHAKRTLEILYVSGVITEEALREAVKQAKLEIEEENDDDR